MKRVVIGIVTLLALGGAGPVKAVGGLVALDYSSTAVSQSLLTLQNAPNVAATDVSQNILSLQTSQNLAATASNQNVLALANGSNVDATALNQNVSALSTGLSVASASEKQSLLTLQNASNPASNSINQNVSALSTGLSVASASDKQSLLTLQNASNPASNSINQNVLTLYNGSDVGPTGVNHNLLALQSEPSFALNTVLQNSNGDELINNGHNFLRYDALAATNLAQVNDAGSLHLQTGLRINGDDYLSTNDRGLFGGHFQFAGYDHASGTLGDAAGSSLSIAAGSVPEPTSIIPASIAVFCAAAFVLVRKRKMASV